MPAHLIFHEGYALAFNRFTNDAAWFSLAERRIQSCEDLFHIISVFNHKRYEPKGFKFFLQIAKVVTSSFVPSICSRYDRSKRSSCQAGNGLPPCSPPIQFLPGILYLPKQRRYGTHCHMPSRPAPSRSQWNIPGQATPWILHPRTFISVGMALQSAVQLTKGRVFLFFNQSQFTHASI